MTSQPTNPAQGATQPGMQAAAPHVVCLALVVADHFTRYASRYAPYWTLKDVQEIGF